MSQENSNPDNAQQELLNKIVELDAKIFDLEEDLLKDLKYKIEEDYQEIYETKLKWNLLVFGNMKHLKEQKEKLQKQLKELRN